MHITRDPGFSSVILALNPSLLSRTPCLTLSHCSSIRLLWSALFSNTIHLPVKIVLLAPSCLTSDATFAVREGREPLVWLFTTLTIRCLHSPNCKALGAANVRGFSASTHLQPPPIRSSDGYTVSFQRYTSLLAIVQ